MGWRQGASSPRATRHLGVGVVSVVENGEIELAEAIRGRDHVDFGDLAICDHEAEYQEQPSAGAITSPTAPSTSAGWVNLARSVAASAPLATVWAPRMTMGAGVGRPPGRLGAPCLHGELVDDAIVGFLGGAEGDLGGDLQQGPGARNADTIRHFESEGRVTSGLQRGCPVLQGGEETRHCAARASGFVGGGR
jgi:hypothetical protein